MGHACDYIDDNGEEISTSLMPEYVQLDAKIHMRDDDDTVEGARAKFAEMQAKMDADVQAHEDKLQEQQKQFELAQQNPDDPAAQLQGLMNAQQSLHRISAAFSPKPQEEKVKEMA